MTVHDLFKADYQTIRRRVAETEKALAKAPAQLPNVYAALQDQVKKYLQKEDVCYRILDDGKRISDRELMHDLRNDNAAVMFSLESLAIKLRNGVPPNEWKKKFDAMTAVLLPHFEREVNDLFVKAEKLLTPSDLKTIQEEIQKIG